jgi:hypothetical protein
MRVIERLATHTDFVGNYTKRSFIEVDVNLCYGNWNALAGGLLFSELLATDPEVPGSITGATRYSEKY